MNRALYIRRRITNNIFLVLSVMAAAIGLGWLALILGTLVMNGAFGFSLSVLTEITKSTGSNGGLANAIGGSLIMTSIAVVVGTPIGIMAGTYLAEYGRDRPWAFFVRFVNDILLSAPSILIGLFIYEILVPNMGHFSGIAGAAALAVIVIPVVVRTTENMLLLVPNTLREAAAALGSPRSHIIRSVTWRAARAGIVTGALLGIARISGETAPLLFTALNNSGWVSDLKDALNAPMASLPVIIYNDALSPSDDLHKLAWEGALLITLAVLTLSIVARLFESRRY
jgi:phosphate transport system permease protein